ncbi:MAG: outer membrane beta-barrel protein [Betaproteobacteria bacterium]|nr:outer membrane beta-barrel protein [Betaproteobacteria bacterium]
MKRTILCCMFAAFFALPALAAAEVNGVYIAPRFLLGIQNSGDFSRTGVPSGSFGQYSQAVVGGALAAGYNFAPKFDLPIRAELEYALRTNSSDSKDGAWLSTKHTMNISTLFLNGYFDINTGTPLTPYVGAGLGMAFNYTGVTARAMGPGYSSNVYVDDRSTSFAWNVGLGLSYAFTENIAADLGYRFIGAGYRELSEWNMKVGSSPYINEFYAGARFTF